MAVIAKQRYKLDIAPKGGWVIVYASQHDNGAREIEFEITNQGNAFSIPASINVSVQGIKSNKSYFSHSCSYSGNIVTMALADDMTDVIGKAICVLKFTNQSNQKLATAKFVLNVDTDSSSEGIIIDTEAEEIFNQMINDIRAQAASISADIAELQSMVGSPLVASTVSAMTDHNKIYVYTGSESGYTNGNWYYWNGSAWTSGGVYNSTAFETDKTLSAENMAADAKVVGDEISDLKEDLSDIKEEVYSEVETEVTKTSQIDGTYIRYLNGAWQTLENNVNYRLMTYSAQENTKYHLVNGSIYKPYVPAVIFYHDDAILGSSEVPTEQTWKGEKVASLYFVTPPTCNKIVTNNFGNPMIWTPALYIISYVGKVSALDNRVSTLEGYNLNTKIMNLQKIAKAVYISQSEVSFAKGPSNAIVVTLPYRMTVFGDTLYAYVKQFDPQVSSGTVTYILPNDNYLIFDLSTNSVVVTDWNGFTNTYTNYVYLACNHGGNISSGILQTYWNTFNIKNLEAWKDTQTLPNYYFESDYLPTKVVAIRNKARELNVFFGFITDVHVRTNHMNAFKLIKYIDDYTNALPFVIFGGDVHASNGNALTEVLKDGDTWLNSMSVYGKERVYQCKGNHDFNTVINGETIYAGLPTDYYYLRRNTDSKVDNPQVETLYGNKTMFYSFDDDLRKMRYIILDDYDGSYQDDVYNSSGVSRAQVDWLIAKLNEGTGYNCVVISHETSDPTMTHYVEAYLPIQKILKAFVNKETVEYTGQGVYVSADFTETENTFVCHISGHAHLDESHVEDNVLSIATVCDALYPRPTAYGTVNEQAFDVFFINTTNKTIETIRIGDGNNRSWTY